MCRVNADVFPGSLNTDIVIAMIVADAVKLTQSGLGDSQSVNRTTLFSLSIERRGSVVVSTSAWPLVGGLIPGPGMFHY